MQQSKKLPLSFCRNSPTACKIASVMGYLLPEVSDWPEWASIFTDVSLWRPVVERVWDENVNLRRAGDNRSPIEITAGYPGTCAVFVVGESVVIKFFPPMVARDFTRELAAYRLISHRVPRIPTLLASGMVEDRARWPYLVVSRLPGEAWRDLRPSLPRPAALAAMQTLGGVVRSTHATPLPRSGVWPAANDWAAFVGSRLPLAGAELARATALGRDIIAGIEASLAATDWFQERPCLVHADLTEDHLLLDGRDGDWEMTGLIDWADAEVAVPQYDWVALWFSICRRDAGLFDAFMTGYGEPGGGDGVRSRRLTAYTFLHRFAANIINEVLTPPEQRAIRTLDELQSVLFGGIAASAG